MRVKTLIQFASVITLVFSANVTMAATDVTTAICTFDEKFTTDKAKGYTEKAKALQAAINRCDAVYKSGEDIVYTCSAGGNMKYSSFKERLEKAVQKCKSAHKSKTDNNLIDVNQIAMSGCKTTFNDLQYKTFDGLVAAGSALVSCPLPPE